MGTKLRPIHRAIKKLRTDRGWSQAHLAFLVDVHETTPSHWERGLCAPRWDREARLAAVFGVSVADLHTGVS